MDIVERYQLPEQFNVELKTTYKGKRVGKNFFDENPEIFNLYPDQQEITKQYTQLKTITSKNMCSILEVTENGILKHKDIKPL